MFQQDIKPRNATPLLAQQPPPALYYKCAMSSSPTNPTDNPSNEEIQPPSSSTDTLRAQRAPPARKRNKTQLQQDLDQQENELHALRVSLENEKAARKAAETAAGNVGGRTEPRQETPIPKPKGTAGETYVLKDEMGLQDDKAQYSTILATARNAFLAARLNPLTNYSEQPLRDLANVFEVAKKAHPILCRFTNNWATAAIVQQYIHSRKRYARILVGRLKEKRAHALHASRSVSPPRQPEASTSTGV
ncbi:hypothetical protein CONPUDRAFT_87204 [Coniophora puteana RWD-64-598 SS2]|uniref:Uncharacterized protein n=1 Tax=Coniophora puteana (strain RWD-64-598) TaxID=741705 RepID=A0A5M3N9I7_CONPW|nr:uncharacterized protein CONPUDRAFT_87204 [Coniophora puteana RWD-64-598 SS2]EIW87425.1 hypothetical protein CONPUDRAFT_87204 [Coniophora puteana RWD-64-598 SS2]